MKTPCGWCWWGVMKAGADGVWWRLVLMGCDEGWCWWGVMKAGVDGVWWRLVLMGCDEGWCWWGVMKAAVHGVWGRLMLMWCVEDWCWWGMMKAAVDGVSWRHTRTCLQTSIACRSRWDSGGLPKVYQGNHTSSTPWGEVSNHLPDVHFCGRDWRTWARHGRLLQGRSPRNAPGEFSASPLRSFDSPASMHRSVR